MLYLGELFQQARNRVRDEGYKYKKGFYRSSQGSSGSSSEEKQSDMERHRKNVMAEERRQAIATNQALLKSTEDQIRLKQLRINKLKTINDYKKCVEVSTELRELLKEKGRIESQLAVFQRKEGKSQWYQKKKATRSKTSGVTSEGDLHTVSSLHTLSEMLQKQGQSDGSSKDSDESGDTLILEDIDSDSKPQSQKQSFPQETSSNSEGDTETPESSQGFPKTPHTACKVRGDEVSIYLAEERTKTLSEHQRVRDDIYVSSFEGLSLKQYKDVRAFVCKMEHNQPCTNCEGMMKVVDKVSTCGFITLKSAFMLSSPGVSCKASAGRRKLLRMPLACLDVGDLKEGSYCFYLVEKQNTVDYQIFQTLLTKSVDTSRAQEIQLSKEELKELLYLADSESEKEMLKYVVVKAPGLSNTKAKEVYRICDLGKRIEGLRKF